MTAKFTELIDRLVVGAADLEYASDRTTELGLIEYRKALAAARAALADEITALQRELVEAERKAELWRRAARTGRYFFFRRIKRNNRKAQP